jgi:hypothetical protein
VRCVGGLAREDQARRELSAPPGAAEAGSRRGWTEERAGSLLTLNLAAVGRGIQVWNDFLAGRVRRSRWLRIEWDERSWERLAESAPGSSPGCPVCESAGLGDYRFGAG